MWPQKQSEQKKVQGMLIPKTVNVRKYDAQSKHRTDEIKTAKIQPAKQKQKVLAKKLVSLFLAKLASIIKAKRKPGDICKKRTILIQEMYFVQLNLLKFKIYFSLVTCHCWKNIVMFFLFKRTELYPVGGFDPARRCCLVLVDGPVIVQSQSSHRSSLDDCFC